MFPLDIDPKSDGPPYPLSLVVYHELLDPHWEMIWVEDVPEEKRRKVGPRGGEMLGVWKRRV